MGFSVPSLSACWTDIICNSTCQLRDSAHCAHSLPPLHCLDWMHACPLQAWQDLHEGSKEGPCAILPPGPLQSKPQNLHSLCHPTVQCHIWSHIQHTEECINLSQNWMTVVLILWWPWFKCATCRPKCMQGLMRGSVVSSRAFHLLTCHILYEEFQKGGKGNLPVVANLLGVANLHAIVENDEYDLEGMFWHGWAHKQQTNYDCDDFSSAKEVLSSEESDSAFINRFEVPFGNALHDLELPSDTLWLEFLAYVAVVMGMRVSSLHIGYVFSFWPKSLKPRPKVLDSDKTWKTLLHDARLWLKGKSRLKRKGRQSVMPWHGWMDWGFGHWKCQYRQSERKGKLNVDDLYYC